MPSEFDRATGDHRRYSGWPCCTFSEGPRLRKMNLPRIQRIEPPPCHFSEQHFFLKRGQTDRQTDRQTERQTDRQTYRQLLLQSNSLSIYVNVSGILWCIAATNSDARHGYTFCQCCTLSFDRQLNQHRKTCLKNLSISKKASSGVWRKSLCM
jgi:hypothetical protein